MWAPNLNYLKVTRLGVSFVNRQLKDIHLSSGLFYFIAELSQHEWLNMSDLSAAVGADNAYATRSIKKLTALGYVKKIQDEQDRRAFRISLTASGRRAAKRVNQTMRRWIEIVARGVSWEDMAIVKRVFDHLYKNALQHME